MSSATLEVLFKRNVQHYIMDFVKFLNYCGEIEHMCLLTFH